MAESAEVLTVVDIGSHTIKGVVVSYEGRIPTILAYSRTKSRGFEQGELKDIVALKDSLDTLLKDLSSQLSKRVESFFVISFVDKTTFLSEEVRKIEIGSAEPIPITEAHVYELFTMISNQTRVSEEKEDNYNLLNHQRTVLHVIPQKYLLDEEKSVLNPIDMEASVLGMKASIISMDSTVKDSLCNAFATVVSDKPTVFVSPFVASEAVLNGKEKERGVVCIDIGHSFLSITGYLNGAVFFLKPVEQGLKYVIKDIAQVFKTSFDEAERLLIQFGKVAIKDNSKDTIAYTLLDGKSSKQITRSQLSIVIYAKIREIMNSVKREMRTITSRMMEEGEKGIPGGLVITGAGARIEGMVEFLRDTFNVPVRIGHAGTGNTDISLPDELQDPTFSGCFGSVFWFNMIGGIESVQKSSYTSALSSSEAGGKSSPRKKSRSTVRTKTPKEGPGALNKLVEFLKKLV
jgi:cell division protein FtsA